MKQILLSIMLVSLLLPVIVLAQTNYPVVTPNSYTPSNTTTYTYTGSDASSAAYGIVFILWLVFALILYCYSSACLYIIAKHVGQKSPWMAWIPIVNIMTAIEIGKSPTWWFLLLLVPFVNIIIAIIIWMRISKAVGSDEWLGLLFLVPVINLFLMGYWAYRSTKLVLPTPVEMPPSTPAN